MSEKLTLSQDTKTFNFYANSAILFFGFLVILYIYKKNNRNIRDEDSYDWSKYNISSEEKFRKNKSEGKDKTKIRTKEYSKGTGFIKEEHKFPVSQPEEAKKKDINFLNYEEVDNLQDMINYAAEMNQNEKNQTIYPIESLYSQVLKQKDLQNPAYTNEKIDTLIADLLVNKEMDESTKIGKILDLYSQLLGMKNKHISSSTYVGLVELFIKLGHLNHASYFLCEMDRAKIKIPRSLLDLFLDYSISKKIFERKEEITFKNNNYDSDKLNNKTDGKFNKYDQYDIEQEPSFAYYFSRKNNPKKKNDIEAIFSKLKVDAKPFFPKSVEEEQFDKIKTKLSEIDPSKVKEFVPKQFKVVKKE